MDKRIIYQRIEQIDNDLKIKGFLIHQRPINAIFEYQKKFNISFSLDSEIANIINDWYENVYGENIKINITKNYLIKIKGDVFVLGSPLFYGTIEIYWGEGDIIKLPERIFTKKIKVDARNFIDYITPTYSYLMQENDIKKSIEWIKNIIEIDTYFKNNINTNSMYQIINGDLVSAKEHFMIHSYDMTAWQCLQVAEKLLKMYIIKHKSQEPKKIHILHKLNEVALINDSTILNLIPILEADPSARYELNISREEAFIRYEAIINFVHSFMKIL